MYPRQCKKVKKDNGHGHLKRSILYVCITVRVAQYVNSTTGGDFMFSSVRWKNCVLLQISSSAIAKKKLAEKILAYQVPAKIQYHALLCFLPFFFKFLLLSYEILNLIQPVNYV